MEIILSATVVSAIVCIIIQWPLHGAQMKTVGTQSPDFKLFQRKFFTGYFIAYFSDWLQGPYIYKLYAYFGYSVETIACLYIIGFASSSVFGTAIGSFGDKIGRSKTCQLYFIFYILCCLTKLSSQFVVLVIGRIFGGIATSLLFSAFESWYAAEHLLHHCYPQEWVSLTFSTFTFWNGILAILAGFVTSVVVDLASLGPVSPFLLAIPFLAAGFIYVKFFWSENYGDQSVNIKASCCNGLSLILSNTAILSLGIIQSCFETVLYVFVFLWTPILSPLNPSLGMVFSSFMICVMIGSSLNQLLMHKHYTPIDALRLSLLLSLFSMAAATFITYTYDLQVSENAVKSCFLCFMLLEIGVGIYFSNIGVLRSLLIPDKARSSTMNWFRVPLNVFTCISLLSFYTRQDQTMFTILFATSSLFLFIAFTYSNLLKKYISSYSITESDSSC